MKWLILLLPSVLFTVSGFSQSRKITGEVYDRDSKSPIEFCNVVVPPENYGTSTDAGGKFTLSLKGDKNSGRLIFEIFGYETDSLRILPGKDHYVITLKQKSVELENVIITGVTRATSIRENPVPITAISPKQIESSSESNIIDVLVKNAPGLTAVKTGPNISKPFIHGLGYNRVLTLYDGIRQEGQQYGDEHGLEVDDYNIEKAEVIKGPASLLYGSDALAGVISMFSPIPKGNDGKIHGRLVSEYQTNNNLIGNGLRLDYANDKFVFALRGSYRMAKNYRNAYDGRVYLTNFQETNMSALAGYKSQKGYTHLNFSIYDNHQGIPDGSRDSLSRRFTRQIAEREDDDITGRPIVSEEELNSYRIPDLSQRIQHYRAFVHSVYQLGLGEIDFTLAGQQNIRREFTHPTLPEQAGMDMRLNTLSYGLRYNAPQFANIETSIGVNGMLQSNKNKEATDFPIPDYQLYDGGVYLYAKWKKEKWSLSGGARYDLRYISWDDFFVGENPQTGFEQQMTALDSSASVRFDAYNNLFHGISGSLGTTFQLNENISLKANIGRAYRSPNITEIGSNGLDPGAHIIYLGNRSFKPEFSLQEDLGISLRYKDFSADVELFNNHIQNYIYMETVSDDWGHPILDTQGNRTQQYQQSIAQLYGYEFRLSIHPEKLEGMGWDNSLSMVRGFNQKPMYKNEGTEGEYLPLIPPLRMMTGLSYEIKPYSQRPLSLTPKFEMQYDAQQGRYLALGGTESFTPSYVLFNLGLSAETKYNKSNSILLVVQANNLFDRAYQSHLNRLKYFEYYAQSPNGYSGIYNMGRNLIVKVIVRV